VTNPVLESALVTDKNQTKISLSQLSSLEQLIDKAPARSASEVSKRRAIAILAPKLYELRSKGYGWRDVAAWLTENGLAVTVPALQRYLRAAKPPAAKRESASMRSSNKASLEQKAVPRESPPASANAPVLGQRGAPPLGTRAPAAKTPSLEPQSRRSAFVPEPDSEDI
jgi:hypothetical protein